MRIFLRMLLKRQESLSESPEKLSRWVDRPNNPVNGRGVLILIDLRN